MPARLFIRILLLFMIVSENLHGQNPYIRQITINDGLPSNNVYNVFQDSRKFIWFATDAGVVRFDGTNFKTYTTADGLSNNEVMRIEEDSQGRLWIFHLNGCFSFIHKDILFTARNTAYLDSLSNNMYFRRLYEDPEGSLYFYSNLNREIFVLDPENKVSKYQLISKQFQCQRISGIRQANMINRIEKHEGVFWLHLLDGLYKANTLTDSLISYQNTFAFDRAFNQQNGRFFLDAFSKKDKEYKILKYNGFKLVDSLLFEHRKTDEIITDILEDKNEHVWLSSYFTGIYIYKKGGLIRHFDIDKAQNLLEDHEGNLWLATLGNGVYRFHPSVLQHEHIYAQQFSGTGIKALAKANENSLLLSDGSYLYHLSNNMLQRSSDLVSEGGINQISMFENGLVILNEPNQALKFFLMKYSSNKNFGLKLYSTSNKPVKQFALSPDERSLTAFYPLFLYEFRQNHHGLFAERNFHERFTFVFYNSSGQLFANGKVIYKIDNDTIIPYAPLRLLFGKTIRQYLNLSNETQLFNISGDSLWLFHEDTLHMVTTHMEQKLPMQIRSMCYDGDSILFIASNSHLYWCPDLFDALDGKKVQINSLNIRFNNIHQIKVHNQILYVATEDGLSSIPLHTIVSTTTTKPIAYFGQKLFNGTPMMIGNETSIVRGSHSFSFTMSSIHFSAEKATYAYMLEGMDTGWTIQQSSNIVYQDLNPGKYAFKFKARLPNSEWSNEMHHYIHVKPTFLQHPLSILAVAMCFAGLLSGLYIRRKNKLLREQETAHQMLLLEQKALNALMNPHFIFNTLGSIQSYILNNNPSDAGLYLSQFARLIRQNMNAIKTSMIPLDEEVDRLRNYLDLERLRMNNRFSFVIDIADGIEEDVLIPTMIIQPIIENAIWHGISGLEGGGVIGIYVTKIDEKSLRIVVEDNGIGIEKAALQTRQKDSHLQIGMDLTMKRLELIGKKLKVETSITNAPMHPDSPYPGTKVAIIVPFVLD